MVADDRAGHGRWQSTAAILGRGDSTSGPATGRRVKGPCAISETTASLLGGLTQSVYTGPRVTMHGAVFHDHGEMIGPDEDGLVGERVAVDE
jgi:hypothetical protein